MFISFVKILFFIVLILLAVLLLLAALLLFVPFRYELEGSYIDERINGKVRLSWLLRLVSFELCYHEGIFISGYIRLMGICIFRIQGKHIKKDDIDGIEADAVEKADNGEDSL